MNTVVFYLRKNQQENANSNKPREVINNMETAEEFIERISTKKYSTSIMKDVNFHLFQLMEISVDCRFVYEWLCKDVGEKKMLFFKNIKKVSQLRVLLDYKKYHFTTNELKQFDMQLVESLKDNFEEKINGLFKDIKLQNKESEERNYSDEEIMVHIDAFINALITQGLWSNLGIITKTSHKIPYDYNADGEKIDIFNFTTISLEKYDKQKKKIFVINEKELRTFYANIADKALDDYIQVWELLQQKQNHGKEAIINKKLQPQTHILAKKARDATPEERVKMFYEIYDVPKDFLEKIKNTPITWEGKKQKVLSYDNKVQYGFSNVFFTYLSRKRKIDVNCDVLLSLIFNKENVGAYIKKDEDYSKKRLNTFSKWADSL